MSRQFTVPAQWQPATVAGDREFQALAFCTPGTFCVGSGYFLETVFYYRTTGSFCHPLMCVQPSIINALHELNLLRSTAPTSGLELIQEVP